MNESKRITIDVSELYKDTGTAKLATLPKYEAAVLQQAGHGKVVILTGQGPVWLYLKLAHALHGCVKKLIYASPVTGELIIYDHDPN